MTIIISNKCQRPTSSSRSSNNTNIKVRFVYFTSTIILIIIICCINSGMAEDEIPPYFAPPPTEPTSPSIIVIDTPAPAPVAPAPTRPSSPVSSPPVTSPTKGPTIDPTDPPVTELPTDIPTTDAPVTTPTTRSPTAVPTIRPTIRPTKSPTIEPTIKATTLEPTISPTEIPTTIAPTNSPSLEPTTLEPTFSPSSKPSISPSNRPSVPPTNGPTKQPTLPPTEFPTLLPTSSVSPTSVTRSPTISPQPTKGPTPSPTKFPTLPPSVEPSIQPSNEATIESTTVAPTLMPTLPIQSDSVEIIMQLNQHKGKLNDIAKDAYESITANHIITHLQNNIKFPVPVKIIKLDGKFIGQTVGGSSTRRRNLQQLRPLRVGLDIDIEYQSTKTDYVTSDWVSSAFNSEAKRTAYVNELKKSGLFPDLQSILVQVDGEIPSEDNSSPIVDNDDDIDDDIDDGNSVKLWVIVGAAAGGTVALLGLAFLIVQKRRAGNNNSNKTQPTSGGGNDTKLQQTYDDDNNVVYAAEINVDRQDDVSTLGDPIGHNGMMLSSTQERDERTASVGADYDYAKHFLGAGVMMEESTTGRDHLLSTDESEGFKSSSASGLSAVKRAHQNGPLGHAVFADDSSFERVYNEGGVDDDDDSNNINNHDRLLSQKQQQQLKQQKHYKFEINVPPGKLGMVIDTPNGGPPTVHAIKPESILCNQVNVGDLLLMVDNVNVTNMSAVQVSKLISIKSDQQRIMTFIRQNDIIREKSDLSSALLEEGAC